jgi:toxin ParE1/3/4
MARIVRTFPARDDLRQIWVYIAQHNLAAADYLVDEIERSLRLLARNPQMGQAVEQYRIGLRQFTVGNYVLFYEPIDGGVRLVRVLHGARKIDELLE